MHRDICLSNAAPIVAWIDAFIRELYRVRTLLGREPAPDGDAVKEVFQQAFEARARWLAGLVNPQARMGNPNTEIPSFAESMGEMFAGRKLMQMQKRFFGDSRDGGPKKK
jgi:hypothetical protein